MIPAQQWAGDQMSGMWTTQDQWIKAPVPSAPEDPTQGFLYKAWSVIESGVNGVSHRLQEWSQQIAQALQPWMENAQNFVWYRALGKKVKEKYPWAYDHIDDALLGKKTLEKYPEYQQYVTDQNNTPFMDHPVASTVWLIGKNMIGGLQTIEWWVWETAKATDMPDSWTALTQFWKWAMDTALWSFQTATNVMPQWQWLKVLVNPTVNTLMASDTAQNVMNPVLNTFWTWIKNVQEWLWLDSNSVASQNIQDMGKTWLMLWAMHLWQKGLWKAYDYTADTIGWLWKTRTVDPNSIDSIPDIPVKEYVDPNSIDSFTDPTAPTPKEKLWSPVSSFLESRLEKTNRLDPAKYPEFEKMTGQTVWSFLKDTGNLWTAEQNIPNLYKSFEESKAQADAGLSAIDWQYKLPRQGEEMIRTLKDRYEFNDEWLAKVRYLEDANKNGGLTLSQTNDLKRMYEWEVKLNYLKENNASAVSKANDIDSAVRNWQFDIADKNGFTNLRDINRQTQAYKFLMDNLDHKLQKIKGNNAVTLTDWLMIPWALSNPMVAWALVWKKIVWSGTFQSWIQKWLWKIAWVKPKPKKVADTENIRKIQEIKRKITPNDNWIPRLTSPRMNSRNVVGSITPDFTLPTWEKWAQVLRSPSYKSDITEKSKIRDPRNPLWPPIKK